MFTLTPTHRATAQPYRLWGVLLIIVALIALSLPQRIAAADPATPVLLSNINTKTQDARSSISPAFTQPALVGTNTFFGVLGTNGKAQLWRTNGTSNGTVLVKEFDLPSDGIARVPNRLTAVGSRLFFILPGDFGTGDALWTSDGSANGTVQVRAINPHFSEPMRAAGNLLFFVASEVGASRFHLWRSDGTAAGTFAVTTINSSDFAGADPSELTAIGTTLYFAANDGINGQELWKSNGTLVGTTLVADIAPGAAGSSPHTLTALNGNLYFAASDGVNGSELWTSDGTADGTTLVKDINPGPFSSLDASVVGATPQIVVIGNTLYFAAQTFSAGRELWKSDGTADGTQLVKDIWPGTNEFGSGQDANPVELTAVGTQLFFVATDATGISLWKSTGTEAGTLKLISLPEFQFGTSYWLTGLGTNLYFVNRDDAHGLELWRSNGTAAGTTLLKDIQPGRLGSDPTALRAHGSLLFFDADDGQTGRELWRSDGTAAGTTLLQDTNTSGIGSNPASGMTIGNSFYFWAAEAGGVQALWKTDGTSAGTVRLKANPVSDSFMPFTPMMAALNNTLYFTAIDPTNGNELWKTDGTPAGTVLVRDIRPGAESSNIASMVAFGGQIYFVADDGVRGAELWRSNGTAAGTTLLKEINPGAAGAFGFRARLNVFGNAFYFAADDGVRGSELWQSDGTASGTVLFREINPGAAGSNPAGFRNANSGSDGFFIASDGFFFSAADADGTAIWKSDGTAAGTTRGGTLPVAWGSSSLTMMNDTLYFVARDATAGAELWRSDGTAAGTGLVKDINPGSGDAFPLSLMGTFEFALTVAGGKLYFFAHDSMPNNATTSMALWQSMVRRRAPKRSKRLHREATPML